MSEEPKEVKSDEEIEEEIKKGKEGIDSINFNEIIEPTGIEFEEPDIKEVSKEKDVVPSDFEVVPVKSMSKFPGPLGQLPDVLLDFCYQNIHTDRNAWYSITFPREFGEIPSVFVSVKAREGWFEKEVFKPPTFSTTRRWFYDPTVDPIAAANGVRDSVARDCKRSLGDWGWFNFIRDAICGTLAGIGWIIGYFIAVFWNVIAPLIGRGIRDAITSAVETELGANEMGRLLSKQAEYSLNQSIPMLYNFSGIPQMKLPIGTYRNVTTKSVEILGYPNADISVFVIGKAKNPLDTFGTRVFNDILERI